MVMVDRFRRCKSELSGDGACVWDDLDIYQAIGSSDRGSSSGHSYADAMIRNLFNTINSMP